MSLCGFLYVPINRHFGHAVTGQRGHSVFGSLARDVVHNEVVGTALGEGVHTWELEYDSSGRVQLRDTSHPHGSSQVDGVGIKIPATTSSEDASVMAHLQSA